MKRWDYKKKRTNFEPSTRVGILMNAYMGTICSRTNILYAVLLLKIQHALPSFVLKLHLFRNCNQYFCWTKIQIFNASSSGLSCLSWEKSIALIFSVRKVLIYLKWFFHLYGLSWTPVSSITTQFFIFMFPLHLLLLEWL